MIKTFRHVEGAALIFQRQSTATQICSSILGRNLFKWYTLIEDECCLLLSCHSALPKKWRREDLRIRKLIAASDYSRVSTDQLQSRMLDDVLQAITAIVPTMADVVATIPTLNGLTGDKRVKTIIYLESKLIYILDYLTTLRTSRLVMHLFQTIEVGFPWKTRHSACCPELPFPPFRFIYPEAGVVFITFLALCNYVQVVLYAPIQANGIRIERLEVESKYGEYLALEMCRGYAAIEDEFGDDLTYLLPCLRPLSVAGFSCPRELQKWYWHKLAHFELLGSKYVEPVRQYLSVVWGMPELLTMGFESWKQTPLESQITALSADEIDMARKIFVTTGGSESAGETDEE
jgi:hypothetical protein